MGKHVGILNGLEFLIRISPMRGSGGAHMGELVDKETDEVVFESDFPSYGDAYHALMEMDTNSWLSVRESPVS
jgi:hypothetical protein